MSNLAKLATAVQNACARKARDLRSETGPAIAEAIEAEDLTYLVAAHVVPVEPVAPAVSVNKQPNGGYPGCDVCTCPDGHCHINDMLADEENPLGLLTYQFTASTGYECEGQASGITPERWGRILAAIENPEPPATAVPDDVAKDAARWQIIKQLASEDGGQALSILVMYCGLTECDTVALDAAIDKVIAENASKPKGGAA
ncbi:hypothetical protein [Pseudogulbenkiania sp. MAI-1]|uniref:hypothetical protein n=1 Tax=Pseudogulbenkiania sp. MAI-1 TaxID=990370 RepID=UPI00045E6700|nr:hypothetical protein [Pseudogulbenkiania sp. MAI-1]